MRKIDSSSHSDDMVKAEQSEMKAVVDKLDESTDDEAKQISAHKALTELKKIRNKQRKF
jgi:hypothetical protein